MEAKFTRGPWYVDESKPSAVYIRTHPYWSDYRNDELAVVYRVGPKVADNARLIAAAPDLYEALRGLIASIDETDPIQMGCSTVAYSAALAALAKATGEEDT